MRTIDYDLENDDIIDVLNDSNISGLSFASLVHGKVVLYVVDKWCQSSKDLVDEVCNDFGYECYVEDQ